MAVTSQFLKSIMAEAGPIIERQLNDAKLIAGFRDVVAANGGDWGALKALIKAHVEDENDDAGDGKRVKKIVDKADDTAAYADMLGLANMNENNFSASQSYAEAKGVEPKHPLLQAAKEMRQSVQELRSTPFDPETGEILSITDTQEQPEETATNTPASRVQEITGGNLSKPSPDAGGEDRAATAVHISAQSEQAAQPIPHSPASKPSQALQAKPETDEDPVSGAISKPLNPNCRRAVKGEQCALMHSQASCSTCANLAMQAMQARAA
ncbi:hypothetical protein [Mesorhizobium sp. A556]